MVEIQSDEPIEKIIQKANVERSSYIGDGLARWPSISTTYAKNTAQNLLNKANKWKKPSIINNGLAQGWLIGSWGGYIIGGFLSLIITSANFSVISVAELGTIFGTASGISLAAGTITALTLGYIKKKESSDKCIADRKESNKPSTVNIVTKGLALGDAIAAIPDILAVIGLGSGNPVLAISASIFGLILGVTFVGYNALKKHNFHQSPVIGSEKREYQLSQQLTRSHNQNLESDGRSDYSRETHNDTAHHSSFVERYLAEMELKKYAHNSVTR